MSPTRKAITAVLAGSALLAFPSAGQAQVLEIGRTGEMPAPSCPESPCQVVSRTTGYQAKAGSSAGLFKAPASGRVVAWSITLGTPDTRQRRFFEERLAGEASAGVTVLRPGAKLTARVVGASPVKKLTPYFGQTVHFPLVRTLAVRKGDVVALTVPTWSPSLALGLGGDTSWRATRSNSPPTRCLDTVDQTAQTRVGGLTRFQCRYSTARLTYTATMVTSPPRVRR